jgi:type I restriction enzyme S subunit
MDDTWKQTRLGDLVETLKGYAFKSGWYCESGRPIVKVSDFTHDSVDSSGLVCIPESIAVEYMKYKLAIGDVVVQTVGSWPSNPASVVGKCVRIPSNAAGALLNQNAVKLTPSKGFDRQFLFYLLRNDDFKAYIIGTAQGAASQAAITLEAIRGYEFNLPPIPIQQRIASILSAYDDLIENNARRIQILERMAQSIYREWFVNFRFPGHEKVKLVDSQLGKIPQGWQPGTLGDIAGEVRRGVNPDQVEPDMPYIGLEHMPRKSIALSEWGTAKEVQSTKLAFKKGEILFGKIRPYFHKVGVAAVDGVCSTDAIVIVPKKQEHFALVLSCVSSEPFVSHATQTSQGTKMPRANWNVLTQYPLPVPSSSLLSTFNECVNDEVGLIQNLLFKNRNLRQTRDLLLPKLVSGELAVSDLNIETG